MREEADRRRVVCEMYGWTREEYEAAPRVKTNWALALRRVDLEVSAKLAKEGNG